MLVDEGVPPLGVPPTAASPPPSVPAAHAPPAACPAAYTYTSHMDLVDELRVQGDMLQRVSAQQHFILSELARMGGMPIPPSVQPVAPWASTTCA
jgi:hypothetical protein